MNTLNRYTMASLLRHLDRAMEDTRKNTPAGTGESNATWNIRMARDMLLEAALGDVAVELPAAAAAAVQLQVAA